MSGPRSAQQSRIVTSSHVSKISNRSQSGHAAVDLWGVGDRGDGFVVPDRISGMWVRLGAEQSTSPRKADVLCFIAGDTLYLIGCRIMKCKMGGKLWWGRRAGDWNLALSDDRPLIRFRVSHGYLRERVVTSCHRHSVFQANAIPSLSLGSLYNM